MTFESPHVLFALLALIPLALLARWVARRRQRRLAAFAAEATWSVLNPFVSKTARRWKAGLTYAALVLAILAAARPTWGTRERTIRDSGIDIMVAIDVSRSMLAEDLSPTRLDEAKSRVRQVLASFPGQRIGMIPFAGEAFVQCPLTLDYGMALSILDSIGPRAIGQPGTDLGRAIEVARGAFAEGSMGTKVLVLITDGEDHGGRAIAQAESAAAEGIRIYTLGIGTPEGAPILLPGQTPGSRRFLEDNEGHKVVSRLDVETLAQLADKTGGASYVSRPGEPIDVRPLIGALRSLDTTEFSERGRVIREERFQFPLALALLLLSIEAMLGDRRREPRLREATT